MEQIAGAFSLLNIVPLTGVVLVAVTAGYWMAKMFPSTPRTDEPQLQRQHSGSNSDEVCPICLDAKTFTVETNCGHKYCSRCIMGVWRTTFSLTPMTCPLCRQEVTILLTCFSAEEISSSSQLKDRLSADIREYNRMYSTHPRSLWDHLRDLPTILRHVWAELFTRRGLEMLTKFRVAVGLIVMLFYVLVPIDLLPEAFLGLVGLVDDVVVVVFVLVQISIVYRTLVVDREW